MPRDAIHELAKDASLDVTIRYAQSGGYFVALDATILQDSYRLVEKYRMPLDAGFLDYAIDRKTGRLFIATSQGATSTITAYDLGTAEQLGELRLQGPLAGMDADNGVLAICYSKTYGEVKAYLYDAQTLQETRTLDFTTSAHEHVNTYPGEVVVDGSRVILTTASQHCDTFIYDLNTDTQVALWSSSYQASVALDRENHVLALMDRGLSNIHLRLYDAISGKPITGFDDFARYESATPYFDGHAFQAFGKRFHANGDKVTMLKEDVLKQRDLGDRLVTVEALVRQDESCIVTLEADWDEILYTMFYHAPTGDSFAMEGDLYTLIEQIEKDRYLSILYGEADLMPYLTVFSLEEALAFGD